MWVVSIFATNLRTILRSVTGSLNFIKLSLIDDNLAHSWSECSPCSSVAASYLQSSCSTFKSSELLSKCLISSAQALIPSLLCWSLSDTICCCTPTVSIRDSISIDASRWDWFLACTFSFESYSAVMGHSFFPSGTACPRATASNFCLNLSQFPCQGMILMGLDSLSIPWWLETVLSFHIWILYVFPISIKYTNSSLSRRVIAAPFTQIILNLLP